MQYTTPILLYVPIFMLFYQDFKDTFVCNTQPLKSAAFWAVGCFIRISKILLYAIHNMKGDNNITENVVLSGFQRYFCMQYTTCCWVLASRTWLFYQDFKDTFVCNTQPKMLTLLVASVVLSGFQRYFCMQYTTKKLVFILRKSLFYQDFKDTFVCNTQL